jgi:hypothetical protein
MVTARYGSACPSLADADLAGGICEFASLILSRTTVPSSGRQTSEIGKPRRRHEAGYCDAPRGQAWHRRRQSGEPGKEQGPCDKRAIRPDLPRSATVTTGSARQQVRAGTTITGRIPKLITPATTPPAERTNAGYSATARKQYRLMLNR